MRIKEIRKQKGIIQKELAAKVGIAANTLSQYETGSREPDIETTKKLALALGVTVDELVGSETKTPAKTGEREITLDDFTYAFYEEYKDLPEEKKKMLLEMAKFMRADEEKKG